MLASSTGSLFPSRSPIFMQICRTNVRDPWQILLEKVQKSAERANWHDKVTYTFIKEIEVGMCVCIYNHHIQKGTVYRAQLKQLEPRQLTWPKDFAHIVHSSLPFAWRVEGPNGLFFLKQRTTWSRFLGRNCCSYSTYLLSSHNNWLQSLIKWDIISCTIVMSC